MNIEDRDYPVPYFLENEEWYYYDEKEEKYKLTEKATEKAKNSYLKFYKEENDDF